MSVFRVVIEPPLTLPSHHYVAYIEIFRVNLTTGSSEALLYLVSNEHGGFRYLNFTAARIRGESAIAVGNRHVVLANWKLGVVKIIHVVSSHES